MIEYILLFALGVILASLGWLMVLPAVTRRAARLAALRLEDQIPRSLEEIEGDRDALRAEFALTVRRLELAAEKERSRLNETILEVGRRGEAMRQSEFLIGQRDQLVNDARAREAALQQAMDGTREHLARTMLTLREAEATIAEREAALGVLQKALGEKTAFADSQRIELAALKTQLEAERITIGELRGELAQRVKDNQSLAAARDEAALRAQRLAGDIERQEHLVSALEGGLTPAARGRLDLVRDLAALSEAVNASNGDDPALTARLGETAARLIAVAVAGEPRGPLAAIVETSRLLHRAEPPGTPPSLLTRIAAASDRLAAPAADTGSPHLQAAQ